jgi:hypothetical protein
MAMHNHCTRHSRGSDPTVFSWTYREGCIRVLVSVVTKKACVITDTSIYNR